MPVWKEVLNWIGDRFFFSFPLNISSQQVGSRRAQGTPQDCMAIRSCPEYLISFGSRSIPP